MAWRLGFSSTLNTTALIGGFPYNATTSAALGANSFSVSVLADQPPDREIHVIVDRSSPPKRNDDWLAQFQGRVRLHFTPTSASWLNQREIVFRLLQPKTLHGGNLKSQDQLREAIEAFIRKHHGRARPFRWRKREVRGSQLRNTVINLCNQALV